MKCAAFSATCWRTNTSAALADSTPHTPYEAMRAAELVNTASTHDTKTLYSHERILLQACYKQKKKGISKPASGIPMAHPALQKRAYELTKTKVQRKNKAFASNVMTLTMLGGTTYILRPDMFLLFGFTRAGI